MDGNMRVRVLKKMQWPRTKKYRGDGIKRDCSGTEKVSGLARSKANGAGPLTVLFGLGCKFGIKDVYGSIAAQHFCHLRTGRTVP